MSTKKYLLARNNALFILVLKKPAMGEMLCHQGCQNPVSLRFGLLHCNQEDSVEKKRHVVTIVIDDISCAYHPVTEL
ncbi:MAG: hypothetical protein U1C33_05965, partial [Candidatus Cloacimonadaceae bacterium]|nr:hypothetical protein [Candidatus Cloacimonadaceae bacterium]